MQSAARGNLGGLFVALPGKFLCMCQRLARNARWRWYFRERTMMRRWVRLAKGLPKK